MSKDTYLPDNTEDSSPDNSLLLEPAINILTLSNEALNELITRSNPSTNWISSKKTLDLFCKVSTLHRTYFLFLNLSTLKKT